ncbi:MAG: PQQ-binding-like beta-propeller repeat protein [Sedimentisphaerales bacterium]|nr:PQQ-binding-like beta-propeller repeat protein [Sedimentisphaerales bacterium]
MNRLSTLAIIIIVLATSASVDVFGASGSDYWPSWRGHGNTGISQKGNPPLTWSETENIKWKVKLTGDESNSSPIIWQDKIFFQTAVKTDVKGKAAPSAASGNSGRRRGPGGSPPTNIFKFNLVCLDRNNGKLLWQKTVREELPHQGHHNDHGFASFTPVTDGKLIWANFGSRGLHCYDLDGNLKWSKDLGKMNTVMGFGEGGSLAVAGDTVVVVRDHEGDSFIIALNKMTGEKIWQKERDEATSWATPLPVEVNGKIQVVVSATNLIRSYDLKTGDIIWQCGGQTRNVIPTPVTGFGMVYCTSGFRGNSLQAIELGHKGDLSNTDAVKWHVKEATPYVPSPLLYGEKLYVCSGNRGVISCYNARTGKPYFISESLEEISGIYASPTGAAGRVYFVGRRGTTYVLKHSDNFEVLAVNKLEDRFDCSPAFVGNEMYLKGKENLYCIAGSK